MAGWTWKQAIADEILTIVNRSKKPAFTINDLYAREAVLQNRFPRNRHVREKTRQTLQRLRDLGLITFEDRGNYELNLSFDDLEFEPCPKADHSIQRPTTKLAIRQIRLRNTLLASDVKKRYEYCCQICRITIRLVFRAYAEAHHIKPLGSPHFGPDSEGNILVVCPNHHVMLDRGAISIDTKSLTVKHIHEAFTPRPLFLASWHRLNVHALSYYDKCIYGK